MKKKTARMIFAFLFSLFCVSLSLTVSAADLDEGNLWDEPGIVYEAVPNSQTAEPEPSFVFLTEQQAHDQILALKEQYPEGMYWTNETPEVYWSYNMGGGAGCHGFALRVSDAVFGQNMANYYTNPAQLRVGDVLRVNNGTHTVVVLENHYNAGYIIVCEANYNSSVHWGRKITISSLSAGFVYGYTRYMDDYVGVESLSLSDTAISVGTNDTKKITAAISPSNATYTTVKWTTSDSNIATVGEDGTVTGISKGTVTITATDYEGKKTATCQVTVVQGARSVSIGEVESTIYDGQTIQLTATVYPIDTVDKTITWSSSTPDVATVDQDGKLTGISNGYVYIYAKVGGVQTEKRLYIQNAPVSIQGEDWMNGYVGQKIQLSTYTYEGDTKQREVTWSSTDTGVAEVDSNGLVTLKAKGSAYIYLYAITNTDWVRIDVSPADAIYVNYSEVGTNLVVGEKRQYTVFQGDLPVEKENLEWYSDDDTVASVDREGNVTAISEGGTIIYAYRLDTELQYQYAYFYVYVDGSKQDEKIGRYFTSNLGNDFYVDSLGYTRCYDSDGKLVTDTFVCDGTYTYYLGHDGVCYKDRLSYHPDGIHVIYFDEKGHEVFSDFAHVKMSIAGDPVDDYCFFDVYGYLYVDVLTYDKTGTYLLYADPYGRMQCYGYFYFSNTVTWPGGAYCDVAGKRAFAESNGRIKQIY